MSVRCRAIRLIALVAARYSHRGAVATGSMAPGRYRSRYRTVALLIPYIQLITALKRPAFARTPRCFTGAVFIALGLQLAFAKRS